MQPCNNQLAFLAELQSVKRLYWWLRLYEMRRSIARLAFSDASKAHTGFNFKGQGVKVEWTRLCVAGLISYNLLKESSVWICGDEKIGLALSGGEVENP